MQTQARQVVHDTGMVPLSSPPLRPITDSAILTASPSKSIASSSSSSIQTSSSAMTDRQYSSSSTNSASSNTTTGISDNDEDDEEAEDVVVARVYTDQSNASQTTLSSVRDDARKIKGEKRRGRNMTKSASLNAQPSPSFNSKTSSLHHYDQQLDQYHHQPSSSSILQHQRPQSQYSYHTPTASTSNHRTRNSPRLSRSYTSPSVPSATTSGSTRPSMPAVHFTIDTATESEDQHQHVSITSPLSTVAPPLTNSSNAVVAPQKLPSSQYNRQRSQSTMTLSSLAELDSYHQLHHHRFPHDAKKGSTGTTTSRAPFAPLSHVPTLHPHNQQYTNGPVRTTNSGNTTTSTRQQPRLSLTTSFNATGPLSTSSLASFQQLQQIQAASNKGTDTDRRRHSVDFYGSSNYPSGPHSAAPHLQSHNNSLVAPLYERYSETEYSSLEQAAKSEQPLTLASEPVESRYRKGSLGSQTILSNMGLLEFVNSTANKNSYHSNNATNNSSMAPSSVMSPTSIPNNHSQHHPLSHNNAHSTNLDELSPTRARTAHTQHTGNRSLNTHAHSASPRYDRVGGPGMSSASGEHEGAGPSTSTATSETRNSNQLEAKIVLLGRQGVGKTSLVHRYMTGQFSSSLPTTIGASFLVKKLVMDGVKVRLQIWDTAGQERFRSMAPMYYRGAHAAILVYDITNEESLADIQVWLDELRRNMSSDLIIQIVGHKADLAPTHRKIDLEHAKMQIQKWISEQPVPASSAPTSLTPPVLGKRQDSSSSGGIGGFSLSRPSSHRQKSADEHAVPQLPIWQDIGISEVSAKEDEGIEDLFLTIASKLVERKVQIEHDRILRSKDSIMISDESKDKIDEAVRGWGCC